MKSLFISYRRDDSAGHAGRLQDGLAEHFGAGRVFMDVSDLKPGQDYVVELDRALAKADGVLVVIGPRWLTAVDASGRRRIDDPGDLVCREISAGLARQATVIPVLVHGATMPAAEAMPVVLHPLARRQAIVLTDQRWDRDLDELARLLDAGSASPAPRAASRGVKWFGAVALLVLLLVGSAAWMKLRPRSSPQESAAATPTVIVGEPTRAGAPPATTGKAAAGPQRFAIALPKVSEVRFRTHRAQFSHSIVAIRQEPRDGGVQRLSLLMRMTNRGPLDEGFESDQFRLVAGEQQIAPTTTFHGATEANAAEDFALNFVLPAAVSEPLLEVRVDPETTRLPIALSARSAMATEPTLDEFGRPRGVRIVDAIKTLPANLAAGQRVEVGPLSYQIVDAVIERETMEKVSLTLTVRCSVPRGGGSEGFSSSTVRLWIDGVPRKPVNFVSEAVAPGDSKDARFVFDLLALPQTVEVGIFNYNGSAKVALSLEPVLKR